MTQTFIDPAQLSQVSDLELLARTVVEGFMTGIHRSPHTGASIEFAQYRPYTQGDDLRFLDWKLFARTDRLHLKQFQEETNLRCTLLLDCSASMQYGSGAMSKWAYARLLCASLAMILKSQGDSIGFMAYHHELATHIPATTDQRNFRRILVELAGLEPNQKTDTPRVLRFLGDVLRPRGMVILISDLIYPLEEVIDHLKSLRARRHDVLVIQISDPTEQTFTFDGAVTLVDAEEGEERFVVPDAVREAYLENRRNHFDTIRRECLTAEIDLAEFTADQPLDFALRHFINHRNRALKTSGLRQSGRA
ncbi:MAG: DUF58 domain-containing protein [Acidobacteriota bacterium]|nr:DUF58 domain-containing protein [Acidobacteriota bacterium]